jgi:hypothetical protein
MGAEFIDLPAGVNPIFNKNLFILKYSCFLTNNGNLLPFSTIKFKF